MSRALSGIGVSPGIAIGEPVVHETRPISTLRITIDVDSVDSEIERFRQAVAATVAQQIKVHPRHRVSPQRSRR